MSFMENDYMQKNMYNYNAIDLCKFIFAFFILAIHTEPFKEINTGIEFYTSIIWKIAVPFFFAASGFLFVSRLKFENGKIAKCKENFLYFKKYVSRIVILYAVWTMVYSIYRAKIYYDFKIFSLPILKDFLWSYVCQSSYYHFWYLLDLIYAIVFIYISLRLVNVKTFSIFACGFYFVGLLSSTYNWVPHTEILVQASSTLKCLYYFAFRATPYIMIGVVINRHNIKIKKNKSLALFFVSFVLMFAEAIYVNSKNEGNYSFLIMTIPTIFFLLNAVKETNLTGEKFNFKLARNMSTFIYCCHPLVLGIIGDFGINVGWQKFIVGGAIVSALAILIIKLSNIKGLKFIKYIY